MTMVILQQMKTAISLPDELFQQVDALAKQLGIPRSQLYARALNEYLAAHGPEHVTAALDAVYSRTDSSLDPNIVAAQAATLSEDNWE
jgi:metal-responsive CopG/Arc/MetJ family transcriptional regulator